MTTKHPAPTNHNKSKEQQRVLLACAPARLGDSLAEQLTADLFQVDRARGLQHASSMLAGRPYDVVLLASLEQPTDALALLAALRANQIGGRCPAGLPAVTLATTPDTTAGGGLVEALRFYETGSDLHLTDPAGYLLIRAALHAVLRRHDPAAPTVRELGALRIDLSSREVLVCGRPVELTATEYRLLLALAAQPTRVMTRSELLRDVWGYPDSCSTRTLDSHAVRLRRKLHQHGHPGAVINIWGVGYRLTDPQ